MNAIILHGIPQSCRAKSLPINEIEAIRCLWWVVGLGGDCFEVELAAGQVDHGGEMVHVPESACSSSDVLDDAVGALEHRVGVRVGEVGQDFVPVPADHAGEVLHGFQS